MFISSLLIKKKVGKQEEQEEEEEQQQQQQQHQQQEKHFFIIPISHFVQIVQICIHKIMINNHINCGQPELAIKSKIQKKTTNTESTRTSSLLRSL